MSADTAWFCERCRRPLRNGVRPEDRPPEDTISTRSAVPHLVMEHDQCGGQVALSTRVAEAR